MLLKRSQTGIFIHAAAMQLITKLTTTTTTTTRRRTTRTRTRTRTTTTTTTILNSIGDPSMFWKIGPVKWKVNWAQTCITRDKKLAFNSKGSTPVRCVVTKPRGSVYNKKLMTPQCLEMFLLMNQSKLLKPNCFFSFFNFSMGLC